MSWDDGLLPHIRFLLATKQNAPFFSKSQNKMPWYTQNQTQFSLECKLKNDMNHMYTSLYPRRTMCVCADGFDLCFSSKEPNHFLFHFGFTEIIGYRRRQYKKLYQFWHQNTCEVKDTQSKYPFVIRKYV